MVALTAALLVIPTRAHAQSPGVCFGPVTHACTTIVLLEANAEASSGTSRTVETVVPTTQNQTITLVAHVRDLPSYLSGATGILRATGPNTALGAVVELGFATESELGNSHRLAITARQRWWRGNSVIDVGAGILGAEVFVTKPNTACCSDRTDAYGGTIEAAVSLRSLIGVVAGADAVHGAGRTSTAARIGVRTGSYASVAVAIIGGIGAAITVAGLRNSN